jgi:hypothetical protein
VLARGPALGVGAHCLEDKLLRSGRLSLVTIRELERSAEENAAHILGTFDSSNATKSTGSYVNRINEDTDTTSSAALHTARLLPGGFWRLSRPPPRTLAEWPSRLKSCPGLRTNLAHDALDVAVVVCETIEVDEHAGVVDKANLPEVRAVGVPAASLHARRESADVRAHDARADDSEHAGG